jgi:hypothetical protein
MEEGRGPLKRFEERESTFNAVRDPMEEERGPLKELYWR